MSITTNMISKSVYKYIHHNYHRSVEDAVRLMYREIDYICKICNYESDVLTAAVYIGNACGVQGKTTRDLNAAGIYTDVFFTEKNNKEDLTTIDKYWQDTYASLLLFIMDKYNRDCYDVEHSAIGLLLIFFVDLYHKRTSKSLDLMSYKIVKQHVDSGEFTYTDSVPGVVISEHSCKMLQDIRESVGGINKLAVYLNDTHSISCIIDVGKDSYIIENDLSSLDLKSDDILKQHIWNILVAWKHSESESTPSLLIYQR